MELVIMAAGLGSRFGGLKQLEPVDENGNFIVDYSIFDAIRCGFDKVVFIIKEENLNLFRDTIGKRIESKIETQYVFQNNSNVSEIYNIPQDRIKPLGTGHAILCAKDAINSNFAVINADDFYGYDAFKTVADFLKTNTNSCQYSLIGYEAQNTLSNTGSVNRGVCISENGNLKNIIESTLRKENNALFAKALSPSSEETNISADTLVSMNMFGFTPNFLSFLNGYFNEFLEQNKNDLSKCEFFLPSVVSNLISENKVTVKLIKTSSKWLGITYKEDKSEIVNAIKNLRQKGLYPQNLWQN